MRITESQLRQIVREEVLREMGGGATTREYPVPEPDVDMYVDAAMSAGLEVVSQDPTGGTADWDGEPHPEISLVLRGPLDAHGRLDAMMRPGSLRGDYGRSPRSRQYR